MRIGEDGEEEQQTGVEDSLGDGREDAEHHSHGVEDEDLRRHTVRKLPAVRAAGRALLRPRTRRSGMSASLPKTAWTKMYR